MHPLPFVCTVPKHVDLGTLRLALRCMRFRSGQVETSARKLIRSLVSSGLEQMDSTAPPYKVFCLALVAAMDECGDAALHKRATAEVFSGLESCSALGASDGQLQDAYQGWLAKHGFTPRMRRCRPVIINVGTKSFLTSECPATLSGIASNTNDLSVCSSKEANVLQAGASVNFVGDSMTWMQHGTAFKGLPQQDAGMG